MLCIYPHRFGNIFPYYRHYLNHQNLLLQFLFFHHVKEYITQNNIKPCWRKHTIGMPKKSTTSFAVLSGSYRILVGIIISNLLRTFLWVGIWFPKPESKRHTLKTRVSMSKVTNLKIWQYFARQQLNSKYITNLPENNSDL